MSKQDDGGPAFPRRGLRILDEEGSLDRAKSEPSTPGMSLRDWFAGQALSGIWAQMAGVTPEGLCPTEEIPLRLARAAYIQAEAMLAERAKGDK